MEQWTDEEHPPVVIDNGSGVIKAGLAGDDEPSCTFQSMIGRPQHNVDDVGMGTRDYYVGSDAASRRNVLKLTYPIQRGQVSNWDDMEKIWTYLFTQELKVESSQHPVIISETLKTPKIHQEKLAQAMFETFKVPALHIQSDAVLSMYASGRSSGIVLQIGDGLTQVVPIYEGFPVLSALKRQEFAGSDITNYLQRLLTTNGIRFSTSAEMDVVRDIKEKLGYVADEYDFECTLAIDDPTIHHQYEVPDGTIITLGKERFTCGETLFNPSLTGLDFPGIHDLIQSSVMASDIDIRKNLYHDIILGGGSTMFPGFPERLRREMKKLAPKTVPVRVVADTNRKNTVWIGGSIIGSMTNYSGVWIKKSEYDEHGSNILQRKAVTF